VSATVERVASPATVRLVTHPTRLKILAAMGRKEFSPVELSDKLGLPLGSVSYHVRMLADAGLLHQTGESYVRGAVQHHYVIAPEGSAGVVSAIEELLDLAKRARKAVKR
jgi:DNA-binding transcriptional ArsR family regulator